MINSVTCSVIQFDLNEEMGGDSNTSLQLEKSNSTALKVNNNMLKLWEGFWPAIERLFVEPAMQLQWIDFSFNDMQVIDDVSGLEGLKDKDRGY